MFILREVYILRKYNNIKFLIDLHAHLLSLGIIHQFSCPYTSQQNDTIERKHQNLLNTVRSLRFQAKLPISFWWDCVLTATRLINLLPTKILNYKSPYEVLSQKQPNYSHLKTFGCLCYTSNLAPPHDKFSAKAMRCMFLGYPFNNKGCRVMNLETRKCYISRDVVFLKNIFSFQTNAS